MSLIICPECKKQVSEYADTCPNCGYPIKKHNSLKDIESIKCPICGIDNDKSILINNNMLCKVCGADLSDLDRLYDQIRIHKQEEERAKQSNLPKCPTCQSTNIKKISATSKATNAVLFGLFGNKRKKQFHCNSCGYEW